MIVITIEYKLLGFLWKRRLKTSLPGKWDELTSAQMTAIPLMRRGLIGDKKQLQIFLGIKWRIAKRIDSYQCYCILKNLDYLLKYEPVSHFIIKNIDWFNAPGNNLKGINFGAFIFGDTHYQNYISGKESDLDRFIACYYYDKSGFNENKIEENARLIRLNGIAIREAIAMNYGLIREWLAERNPYVFQKPVPGEAQQSSAGWLKVFDRVVGKDIVRQHEYALLPATEVLRYLNNVTEEFYRNGCKV